MKLLSSLSPVHHSEKNDEKIKHSNKKIGQGKIIHNATVKCQLRSRISSVKHQCSIHPALKLKHESMTWNKASGSIRGLRAFLTLTRSMNRSGGRRNASRNGSHKAPYLPPKFCISIVFNFSYRTAVKPRRNEEQRLCNIWGGGQKRCIVEDVQVTYWQILSLVLSNSPRSLLLFFIVANGSPVIINSATKPWSQPTGLIVENRKKES